MADIWTRTDLSAHLTVLGLAQGDSVLVHAGLRAIGTILGGPDTLIAALRDAVGPTGTILGYCDWQGEDDIFAHPELRDHIPPFDPATSRAIRDNGAFPEFLRTTPGACRSASPGASCAALGQRADWFIADHALDYGYGLASPFGNLVAANGKTLLLGAPLETMTLLHHAEHLADIPGKRIRHYEWPILVDGRIQWRKVEEFDTTMPIVGGLSDDYFEDIVEDFLATGLGHRGLVGYAPCVLVDAAPMVRFATDWL